MNTSTPRAPRPRKTTGPAQGSQLAAIRAAAQAAGPRGFTRLDVAGPWDQNHITHALCQAVQAGILRRVQPATMGRYGKPAIYLLAEQP